MPLAGCFPLSWAGKTAGRFCPLPNTPCISSTSRARRRSAACAFGCRGVQRAPHHALAFIALALCFQPDASPGYCWPFQGSRSEVLIRLPTQTRPTAIIIQHASKIASPLGTVSSAPRDFTVSVSLCRALGAGTWPRGKAVTGTCCSLRIVRDSCAPKHCRSLRGHFKGHAGCCHSS